MGSDCKEGLSSAQSSVISGTDQGSSEPGESRQTTLHSPLS